MSLDLGDPVTPGVGVDVVSSPPVILGVIEHLGDGLPLGIVGMVEGPVSKICSGTSSDRTNGNLVLKTIGPPTCSKQQLVDYQKVRKDLPDCWFQDLMGTFKAKQI